MSYLSDALNVLTERSEVRQICELRIQNANNQNRKRR